MFISDWISDYYYYYCIRDIINRLITLVEYCNILYYSIYIILYNTIIYNILYI